MGGGRRWIGGEGGRMGVPRLSAAMTTPSLNLRPMTEVPVTMGCWVCCDGPPWASWLAS